jgi:hypothetical protein
LQADGKTTPPSLSKPDFIAQLNLLLLFGIPSIKGILGIPTPGFGSLNLK